MTQLHWARAHRGRVWHICFSGSPILCSPELRGTEFTLRHPPDGAIPCNDCRTALADACKLMAEAVTSNAAARVAEALVEQAADELDTDALADEAEGGYVLDPAGGMEMAPLSSHLRAAEGARVELDEDFHATIYDSEGKPIDTSTLGKEAERGYIFETASSMELAPGVVEMIHFDQRCDFENDLGRCVLMAGHYPEMPHRYPSTLDKEAEL